MRISKDDKHATQMAVFDAAGQRLPYVLSYDTETKEIEMVIKLKDEIDLDDGAKICHVILDEDFKPFAVKFVLPGSYATDKDGNKLK